MMFAAIIREQRPKAKGNVANTLLGMPSQKGNLCTARVPSGERSGTGAAPTASASGTSTSTSTSTRRPSSDKRTG
eukprot:Skav236326  [mRNA]  locus=scaffold97:199096:199743:+ [translate_table: standard]